ncbi:MAG TPA: hypothetical protein VFQ06_13925 [Nitrospira sp.]|nr:hypothetical protein [Nitrospira sp.]
MAAVTSYTTLKTAVQNWIARGDVATYADELIQQWEEDFLRNPRNWGRWMETALSSAISSSVIAVPAAYLGLKYAYINGSPASRLDRVSLNQLYGSYPRGGGTGRPRWIARDVTNFVFGPAPDSDYTVKGVYWAKPTALRSYSTGGADAAAHWIILNAPDLALYGSLLQASPFFRNDARVALWQTFYDRGLVSYRDQIRDEDVSGSPVQELLA